jgi:hypothetical protein
LGSYRGRINRVKDSDSLSEAALLTLAKHLTELAGKSHALALSRLDGGKNNQVYRVETANGEPLVLKHYFSDSDDYRDRLAAEWKFLEYARSRGVSAVPEPIVSDEPSRTGLYSFVRGRKLAAAEICMTHVEAAIDFILAINAPPRAPSVLAPGSEACFSLANHLATVERRITRLSDLDPQAPHVSDARRFISDALYPAWKAVKSRVIDHARTAKLSMDHTLTPKECCLSPSDFGFHNALVDERGSMTFLDFEYAGRDDPAKLICDFFCQPEIPVPLRYLRHFVDRLAKGLELDDFIRVRCDILLDVYRIKWSCITLNDFLPLGSARRAFKKSGFFAAQFATQLANAQAQAAGVAHNTF